MSNAGRPVFSVVMPVYNKVRHVEAAIRSVLEQSFSDFELIAVDDASTDGSGDVARAIDDERIRHLRRDTPGPGGYAARNLGIAEATGHWVAFLDADDAWAHDHLEQMGATAQRFPTATLLSCAWHRVTGDGRARLCQYAREDGARGPHIITLRDYLEALRRNVPPVCTNTMAIRMDALTDRAVFPAALPGRRGGDTYAWLTLMSRHKQLAWSPHVGAIYRIDADNMVTKLEPNEAAFLTRALMTPLEARMSPPERRLLRRALNGKLWRSWVGNTVRGGGNYRLPPRLFWRGAWLQASGFALASATPAPLVRWLQRRRARSWTEQA